MVKIYVKKASNYPVLARKIKAHLGEFFKTKGIVSRSDVFVYIVGKKVMLDLARRYLGEENKLHSVLSFPESENKGDFVYPLSDTIHLGEIYICFPEAVEQAKKENVMIEQKVLELLEHGALHLLGIHHE